MADLMHNLLTTVNGYFDLVCENKSLILKLNISFIQTDVTKTLMLQIYRITKSIVHSTQIFIIFAAYT